MQKARQPLRGRSFQLKPMLGRWEIIQLIVMSIGKRFYE